jgi:hypothetical protein
MATAGPSHMTPCPIIMRLNHVWGHVIILGQWRRPLSRHQNVTSSYFQHNNATIHLHSRDNVEHSRFLLQTLPSQGVTHPQRIPWHSNGYQPLPSTELWLYGADRPEPFTNSGGARFKFRPADYRWLRTFVAFLSLYREIPDQCLQLGQSFPSASFPIHHSQSSNHSTLYSLSFWERRQTNHRNKTKFTFTYRFGGESIAPPHGISFLKWITTIKNIFWAPLAISPHPGKLGKASGPPCT